MATTADVVIAGGGIGGTVLAGLLGRAGRHVIVLERSTEPPHYVRPEILWPSTIQILFSLLPREWWEGQAMLPLRGVDLHDGRAFPMLTPETLRISNVQPWSADPNRTRQLLMSLGTFELRRGVEVTGLLKDAGRIAGVRTRDVTTSQEKEVSGRWVVGDDGVHSRVRDGCGIPLTTQTFPLDLFCFGFDWPPVLPPAKGRAWLRLRRGAPSAICVTVPLPHRRGAGIVGIRPHVAEDPAQLAELWERLTCTGGGIGMVLGNRRFPDDFVRVRRPWGHVPRYGMPGAVLMGDAAHPVSPAGGQGANMSVADASTLAGLFLDGTPDLPREYERRRRTANERSIGMTATAARLWSLPERWFPAPLIKLMLRTAASSPFVVRRGLRYAATAFVSRDGSPAAEKLETAAES